MIQSKVTPQRPVYEEPAPLNRRIYFGAVNGVERVAASVSAVLGVCGDILVGLLEFLARWISWVVWALIIFMLHECASDGPNQGASQTIQASQPAQTASSATHPTNHRHRTHHAWSGPASSALSTASSAGWLAGRHQNFCTQRASF
jgi:hypothetical protein